MTQRPNILLVVFDTARADVFEPYGAPTGASPTVRQLASAGAAGQQVYAPASWTVPSHAAMFTGLLPRSAGLNHIGGGDPTGFRGALEQNQDRLLSTVLGRHGYDTGAISANLWINPSSGFNLGFDRFQSIGAARSKGFQSEDIRSKAHWYLDALKARIDDGATRIEGMLRDWLAERQPRPFFWFVNLVECHSPYLPPKPWNSHGPVNRLRVAREAKKHLTFESIWRSSVGGFRVPDGALTRMRQQYADSIAQLDSWLARVVTNLDQAGVLDDTQIIITSDHGENFGENCLLGHAFSLDDRLIRVPFITSGPLDLSPDDRPMSLVELPHRMGEALGLEHPWEPAQWSETPVAQFDAPGQPDDEGVLSAVERWGLGQDAIDRLCTSFTCATDGRFKVVRRLSGDVAYDLHSDPLETDPVPVHASDETDRPKLRRLQGALDKASTEEVAAVHSGPSEIGADERQHLEDQMRLLGYL